MKSRNHRRPRTTKKTSNSRPVPKREHLAPQTAEEYFAKSERFQDMWENVLDVIAKMRNDLASLQRASREFGLTPRTVIRWGGPALRRRLNGQYVAKASDRLLRVLVILTHRGQQEIALRDSRQATVLGKYWDAVQKYRDTGDASGLQKFRGTHITDMGGVRFLLITELNELDRLGSAGFLSFESFYARAA
jgi:hypothetical protein